jgi:hypothetical protein
LQFPFNQRRLMGPWSFFFSANVRFKPADSTDQRNTF